MPDGSRRKSDIMRVHKGAKVDARYLTRRKEFSENIGKRELFSVIDHWPLYAGTGNIGRWLAIYEILKRQLSVPGDIAEFGSWRGANLMFMAKAMHFLDPHGDKKILCFDNFAGLPEFSQADGNEAGRTGTYCGSLEELQAAINLAEMDDSIFIYPGLIEDSLPDYLESDKGATFSLLYFDADLYEPAVTVLDHGHRRLAKGGVFIFDEWNTAAWPGEGIAVRDFMEKHGDSYEMEHITGTRQPSLILRKTR
jgi:hypothetical protein